MLLAGAGVGASRGCAAGVEGIGPEPIYRSGVSGGKKIAASAPYSDFRGRETVAGRRNLPLSDHCKAELIRWRNLVGPEFSRYVFPNLRKPSIHLKSVKKSWRTTLRRAAISYFPIYNLRAAFASRLSAAGTPDVLVAQMIGHSTPSILQTYAKAIDESRRAAIDKLARLRNSQGFNMLADGPGRVQ